MPTSTGKAGENKRENKRHPEAGEAGGWKGEQNKRGEPFESRVISERREKRGWRDVLVKKDARLTVKVNGCAFNLM